MRAIILLVLVVLCGCEEHHTMTECRGSFAAANPGKWQPTPEDLHK
jgi:hypothetical protein